ADVDDRLATMWHPDVAFSNQTGEATASRRTLRIGGMGDIELRQRTTAQFATSFDLGQFPFDRQSLHLNLVSRRERSTLLGFNVRDDDLSFSQASRRTAIDGWAPVRVAVTQKSEPSWYGESQEGLDFSLDVVRRPGAG